MALDALIAAAGTWRGTSRLYGPGSDRVEDSASALKVTPVLHGTFVRIDYDWSFAGAPQEGSLLVGEQPEGGRAARGVVTAHWIDTFHNGRGVMALQGVPDADGVVEVRGSYPAPPAVDWGWRITLTCDDDALQVAMFNIAPDGTEYPAVEAAYARVDGA